MEDVRAKLDGELKDVQEELERLNDRLRVRGDYGFGKGDPAVYQWELNLSLKERYEEHLAQLQEALRRVEEGSYGKCERCHNPIDVERLEVVPFAALCIKCAQESD